MGITRRLRNFAFVVLLASLVFVAANEDVRASSCTGGSFDGYTAYWWGCGWFDSDPCSDGTVEWWCASLCWPNYGSPRMISCQSSGPPYWLSWAECQCIY
jgi:hypothetical protein